jgi:hypothetical protein
MNWRASAIVRARDVSGAYGSDFTAALAAWDTFAVTTVGVLMPLTDLFF